MYNKLILLSWLCILLACSSTKQTGTDSTSQEMAVPNNTETTAWKTASSNGYTYRYVENDPMKARFYTLKNGLSVILSESNTEPKIEFRLAVRSGSNSDPKDHTGLAHYLEHMLFKGTDKFGSLDWEKESVLVDQIEQLYEQLNHETDEQKRKDILHQIDKTSGKAAEFAIASEYDKMMKSLGSSGTNAWTSFEETVYTEAIPNNEVDKLLTIQAERFRQPVFRLFHTELETVYEEKNRALDNDQSVSYETLMAELFPSHNYGQQTTIGTIEHLKNPSLTAIRDFYNKNYVPNNLGVILVGDFDSDELIAKVDAAFGYMESKPLEAYQGPVEQPLNGPIIKEISTKSPQYVIMGYRTPKAYSREAIMTSLIESILANGKTGLMDENIRQQQTLVDAGTFYSQMKDYGMMMFYAYPFEGQSLKDTKEIVLEQIKLLQAGQFSDDLIPAIIANKKLDFYKELKNQPFRSSELVISFILGKDQLWDKQVAFYEEMQTVTKQEVMDFAKELFTDKNYVAIFKKEGEEAKAVQVQKPPITPIKTNTEVTSPFVQTIYDMPSKAVTPAWVNFEEGIQKGTIGNVPLLYVQNQENKLFDLTYHFDFGANEYPLLPVAAQYLELASTESKSSEAINQAFYNMASSYSIQVGEEETTINLTGLQENFATAVALLEEKINQCLQNETILGNLIDAELTVREDNKLQKGVISQGLFNYAVYGPKNSFNTVLSNEAVQNIKVADVVQMIKSLQNKEHSISYYGPATKGDITTSLQGLHAMPQQWSAPTSKKTYQQVAQTKNKILFVDFDDVQTEVYWIRNLAAYTPEQDADIQAFNSYFGGGMGSLMFKEVREAKALAYSTYGVINTPYKQNMQASFMGYVGCQADKLPESIETVNGLLKTLPIESTAVENSKNTLISNLNAERIQREDYISRYLRNKKRGFTHDIRKDTYQKLQQVKASNLQAIHQQYLSGQPYTYLVIGAKDKVDMKYLSQYGEVEEISLEEIFGYGPVVRKETAAVDVPAGEYLIQGKIVGGQLKFIHLVYDLDGEQKSERCEVKNGQFSFKGTAPAHAIRAELVTNLKGMFQYYVYLEPGHIQASLNLMEGKDDLYGLRGTPTNEKHLQLYNSTRKEFKEAYALMEKYYAKEEKGEDVKELEGQITSLFDKADKNQSKFVADNLNSVVTAYNVYDNIFSYQMDTTTSLKEVYESFDDAVKTTPIGQQLKAKIAQLEKISVGKPALEISMPNHEGEIVPLSSQKGKYVLLDFWATWCGPCVQELPHLMEVYEKHHENGFEVYAVSLDTRGSSWKSFIAARKLTWINVSDLKNDNVAATDYSVSAVPTNFLIDPEGTIIEQNIPMEELDKKLKSLLEK